MVYVIYRVEVQIFHLEDVIFVTQPHKAAGVSIAKEYIWTCDERSCCRRFLKDHFQMQEQKTAFQQSIQ